MATYKTRIDQETGITFIDVEGAITADDWMAFMQSEEFNNRTKKILCDQTRATLSAFETDAVIKLARQAKPLVREGVRAAYVLARGADFGIANMFKVYSDQLRYKAEIEPFTDRERALAWLLQK